MSRQKERQTEGAQMSRTWTKRTKIIGALAAVLAAAALVPSAGVAASTSSERATVKSCGQLQGHHKLGFIKAKVDVVEGNVPCRVARRVMMDFYTNKGRVKAWNCGGSEGHFRCFKNHGPDQGTVIRAVAACQPTQKPKACDGRPNSRPGSKFTQHL
ncbi:MAG: hypothetical protein M3N43_05080, partial [Actinomycetota bacterium]|nr:hypothetical protein [Actinomycetota bacterium]